MHDKSFITIGLHHKKYQKGYEKTEEWRLHLKEIWVLKTKSLNHCQGTKHVRLIQSKESYLNCLDSSIACTSLIKIFNSNKTLTTFNDTTLHHFNKLFGWSFSSSKSHCSSLSTGGLFGVFGTGTVLQILCVYVCVCMCEIGGGIS